MIVGDATRFLHKIAGPFDLIFQDSDKQLYLPMLDRLIELLRPGGLLVADNVLWNGEVVPGYVSEKKYSEEDTSAIVSFSAAIADDARLYTFVSASRRRRLGIGKIMTIAEWLAAAKADAEQRGLPELLPMLDGLAQATERLRAADWNDDPSTGPAATPP